MILGVTLPEQEVKNKLGGLLEVHKVEATRGLTLIIVEPRKEVTDLELRMNIEKLLNNGSIIWLA